VPIVGEFRRCAAAMGRVPGQGSTVAPLTRERMRLPRAITGFVVPLCVAYGALDLGTALASAVMFMLGTPLAGATGFLSGLVWCVAGCGGDVPARWQSYSLFPHLVLTVLVLTGHAVAVGALAIRLSDRHGRAVVWTLALMAVFLGLPELFRLEPLKVAIWLAPVLRLGVRMQLPFIWYHAEPVVDLARFLLLFPAILLGGHFALRRRLTTGQPEAAI
jgi:hypothetical protein